MSLHLSLAAAAFATLAGHTATQVTITLEPVKDTTLYETSPLSNGAGDRMFCGRTGSGRIRRGLLAFDVSQIPACATITSVQLLLFMTRTTASSSPVDLHAVTSDWGESASFGLLGQGMGAPAAVGDATWLHSFQPASLWTNPGGDFSTTVSASTLVSGNGRYTWGSTAQLVADVQGWKDDPGTNFGWMLRSIESQHSSRAFSTREAQSLFRPKLSVTFTTAAVAVSQQSGIPTVGCAGTGATPLTATANGVPTIPNPAFSIQLSGGPPAVSVEAVVLTVGLLPFPIPLGSPGCNLFVDVIPFHAILLGSAGSVPLPVPALSASSECQVLSVQGLAIDAATAQFVLSNALDLTFGR